MSNIEKQAIEPVITTEGMTYSEMKAFNAKLEKAMKENRKSAQKDALAQIVSVAADHELTAEDIAKAMKVKTKTKRTPKAAGPKAEPMYQDPESGATWSGKGRKPKWFVEAEETGQDTDAFLIAA